MRSTLVYARSGLSAAFVVVDGRVWLLAIVRNACYSRLKRGASREHETEFDDEVHSPEIETANHETLLERSRESETLRHALEDLPEEFREVVVMRELEGMAYKDIAEVAGVPIGTVMSRLARAQAPAAGAHCRAAEGVLK
jgi:RNA polymerase sigma factor (sigma-70 family)